MSPKKTDQCHINQLFEDSITTPDLVIDGVHFGRGDSYTNTETSTKLKHQTTQVTCWRVLGEELEELEAGNCEFYSGETYIIRWRSTTDSYSFNSEEVIKSYENEVYFYWKGEDAAKGFSPLPASIEKENPPVVRIVQWSEPPAFLRLFSGKLKVFKGKQGRENRNFHLYILRGELEKEIHFFEVDSKKESLRSRTSFVLHFPKENSCIVWHGNKSNPQCKNCVKNSAQSIFGGEVEEVEEGSENEKFIRCFENDESEVFIHCVDKVVDYTPRLFYFNNICGQFLASEVECSHKSSFLTPFPFLQSHLYTADQPAIFLLDDHDEIWIWYGWQLDEDDSFKSECFITAIDYAKQKSKTIQKLVKVHKVVAGFEPAAFTNLFPTWKKREDVVQLQQKDGVLPEQNPLIQVIAKEGSN